MLKKIDPEMNLLIAGNHDLELDEAYWQAQFESPTHPREFDDYALAKDIMTLVLAAETGVTHRLEGTHTFTLKSGATFKIFASPYTPTFSDWAFAYQSNQDQFNSPAQVTKGATPIDINPISEGVDIIMTHGPLKGILNWFSQG